MSDENRPADTQNGMVDIRLTGETIRGTGQIVRADNPYDEEANRPKPDFLSKAESILQQGCLLASIQTPGIDALDAYGREHQLALLTYNLPIQNPSPELRALRRSKPMEQLGHEHSAVNVHATRLEHLIADDIQAIAVGRSRSIGHIRMRLAMPYAMAANGPMIAVDTRLEAFYAAIVRDNQVCQALSATMAESLVHDTEVLRKILLSRLPRVNRRHFNHVLVTYIREEETCDSKNSLFDAWQRIENKRLVIEQITAGAGPIQASARIMNAGGYHWSPTVRFDAFLPRANSHTLKDPVRWARMMLGDAILKLAASRPPVPAASAQRIYSASIDLGQQYTLPRRPKEFVRGHTYAETGGHVPHTAKDGSVLMRLLNGPADSSFFKKAVPREFDRPEVGGRPPPVENPSGDMFDPNVLPPAPKPRKVVTEKKPGQERTEEQGELPAALDLFSETF